MSKGFEGPATVGYVLYGNAGSPDISTPERRRETRDFMSRNSLGSPTFMFYPVIMMSTYTPDKTKHYPSSFPSTLLPSLSLSLSLSLSCPLAFPTHPLPRSSAPSRCRNRNSSATRKCQAFLRAGKCSSSDFHSSLLLFRQDDASGRSGNACRLPSYGRPLIAAAIL